jgi:hypothetical protein
LPSDTEWVLEWETYDIQVLGDGKRCFFCDDLHYNTPKGLQRRMNKFVSADIILATYAPLMNEFEYPKSVIDKTIWIPHCASDRFLIQNTYKVEQEPLLILPMPSKDFEAWYPNRLIISKIAKVKTLNHPGYTHYPTNAGRRLQNEYNADLNIMPLEFSQAFGVITDSSVYHYLLAKHFEIMASGSLLICDEYGKQWLEKLGYQDNVHFVSYTIKTFATMVESLKDPIPFMKIREAGSSLTKKNHLVSDRVHQILSLFDF